MNKFAFILIYIFFLGLIFFSGCVEEKVSVEPNNNQKEVQKLEETASHTETSSLIPEPEETLDEYVYSFNNLHTEHIYVNLISNELKRDKSEDEVHNLIYAYKLQRIQITKYKVINKTITGNTASMDIEFVWDVQGFRKTSIQNINLLLEDNKWKIDGDLITM